MKMDEIGKIGKSRPTCLSSIRHFDHYTKQSLAFVTVGHSCSDKRAPTSHQRAGPGTISFVFGTYGLTKENVHPAQGC